ncbi:hypothetical protein NE237_002871 [Protea cynaroides]|uniref:Uncharacterized protein n=1 Tax=Protea cynaroides TaxID=273540 RepID=A0A9Q0KFX2_9MAGN|nr:hypothetical protein NE237_002871 [Protea cynaroides]
MADGTRLRHLDETVKRLTETSTTQGDRLDLLQKSVSDLSLHVTAIDGKLEQLLYRPSPTPVTSSPPFSTPSEQPPLLPSPPIPHPLLPAPSPPRIPIKRLTPMEMQDRRDKGLCYNCDEKFVLGHRCKHRQLFLLEYTSEDDEPPDPSNPEPVADLDLLTAVPLPAVDRVFEFGEGDARVRMLSDGANPPTQLGFQGFTRLMATHSVMELFKLDLVQDSTMLYAVQPDGLADLLETFTTVFHEPSELPPHRTHDHHIPLHPGAPPVNLLQPTMHSSLILLGSGQEQQIFFLGFESAEVVTADPCEPGSAKDDDKVWV